jgi:Family of unknown function (DUF6065)
MIAFIQMYPAASSPIRADKAALGAMPIQAFRYCEPMRLASSHGWYIFPPVDIELLLDGQDILFLENGKWQLLETAYLPGHIRYWNEHAPPKMRGLVPPYLRALPPLRGGVQIWSGFLIRSKPGWWSLVRGICNVPTSSSYKSFEGVIESDKFSLCPLFVNIELIRTEVPIRFSKGLPLFQVQPMLKEVYSDGAHTTDIRSAFASEEKTDPGLSIEDWAMFRTTIRKNTPDEEHKIGDYAKQSRKNSRLK